jgi:hypothetical protein
VTTTPWAPGIQVWVYPEELLFTPPEALAEQVAELGCAAASMSVVYHRARRVFPRHGAISVLATNGVYFTPELGRYGTVVPEATATPELQRLVRRFRDACAERGLRFRAWLVGLHGESLARTHPDVSTHALDGSPLLQGLCPSAPESVEYVAALARDVAEQLEPELVDLEAWQYPAWEPAYTLTQALEPLSARAELLATQCFCASCRALVGTGAAELEERARRAAGHPFGAGDADLDAVVGELAAVRATGARAVASAVADSVHAGGALLRLLCSGAPEQARLQGVAASTVAPADTVGLGGGKLHGADLHARFTGLRELVAGVPHALTVSTNWTPERTPETMAEDVRELARLGADGLSLYNLSLVPEAGLEAFAAAAAAFRSAKEQR